MKKLYFFLLLIALPSVGQALDPGDRVNNFKLQGYGGGWHSLWDAADRKAVVVVFVGVECPIAKQYGPRLAELAADYQPQGIGFFAIDSNQQDSLLEIGQYARQNKIEFSILKDLNATVADRFGAERTIEAFLLDKDGVVRYRGRIDDQYGVGYARPAPSRRDLGSAIDDLLAGRPVSVAKDGRRGVPHRPCGAEAAARRDDVLEAHRAHSSESLRHVPPGRTSGSVLSHQL